MPGTSGNGRTGLINLGNTCYLNAVIQSFAQLPTLRRALLEARDNKTELLGATQELLRDMWSGKHTTLSPLRLKKAMDERDGFFLGPHQHDAHEFMRSLLNLLHEDLSLVAYEQLADVEGSPPVYRRREAATSRFPTYLVPQNALAGAFLSVFSAVHWPGRRRHLHIVDGVNVVGKACSGCGGGIVSAKLLTISC
jgi:hypothetical protein